jgi:APA family basic amino acid/polyamine antiporter
MARDGVFFKAVGRLNPKSRVPVVAIVLQGAWAALIALTGKYDQILNYVEAIDVLFFGLTGASLIIFRMRARKTGDVEERVRVPLHPITTLVFVLACWLISLTTVVRYPAHAGVGFGILLVGVAVYFLWARRGVPTAVSEAN